MVRHDQRLTAQRSDGIRTQMPVIRATKIVAGESLYKSTLKKYAKKLTTIHDADKAAGINARLREIFHPKEGFNNRAAVAYPRAIAYPHNR